MKRINLLKEWVLKNKKIAVLSIVLIVLIIIAVVFLFKVFVLPVIGIILLVWVYLGCPLPEIKPNTQANEIIMMNSINFILNHSLLGLEEQFGLSNLENKGLQRIHKISTKDNYLMFQSIYLRLPTNKPIDVDTCEQLRFVLLANILTKANELIYDGFHTTYLDLYVSKIIADEKKVAIISVPILNQKVKVQVDSHYNKTIQKANMEIPTQKDGINMKRGTLYDDIE